MNKFKIIENTWSRASSGKSRTPFIYSNTHLSYETEFVSVDRPQWSLHGKLLCWQAVLTHCILNRLSHTIYWKSPISILGTSSYEIYIFLEKNG